jgi:toxin YoeB
MKPLKFLNNTWDEYQFFNEKDKKSHRKIISLIKDIDRNGESTGIGKPEPLKGDLAGWWSREIDKKNRLVYRIADGQIELSEVGSHYGDK